MKSLRKRSWMRLICGGLLILGSMPAWAAQTSADEALKKKYEKILGKYDFDYSSIGGETAIVEVRVGDGTLWIDDGDGRPAQIRPVNDTALEFTGEDAVAGAIQAIFTVEEETGAVKFRLVVPQIGLDVTGVKRKD